MGAALQVFSGLGEGWGDAAPHGEANGVLGVGGDALQRRGAGVAAANSDELRATASSLHETRGKWVTEVRQDTGKRMRPK